MRIFRERLSVYGCSFFPFFGLESEVWDLIVLIPDHCVSIYFQIFNSLSVQGPVVQSIVSLTSSLHVRGQLVKCFTTL